MTTWADKAIWIAITLKESNLPLSIEKWNVPTVNSVTPLRVIRQYIKIHMLVLCLLVISNGLSIGKEKTNQRHVHCIWVYRKKRIFIKIYCSKKISKCIVHLTPPRQNGHQYILSTMDIFERFNKLPDESLTLAVTFLNHH